MLKRFNFFLLFRMSGNKTKILVYGNGISASCEGDLENVNDILEDHGIIICAGKKFFEIFQITQDNNLKKLSVVPIMINGAQVDENITCLIEFQNLIICGHESGMLSVWKPGANPMLNYVQSIKVHNGRINKIYMKNNGDQHFALTCSSDGVLKVFNAGEAFKPMAQPNLGSPVYNVFECYNFEKQDIFLTPLDHGIIYVNDNNFNKVFEIWSNHGGSGENRKCLTVPNSKATNQYGELLITT